MCVRDQLLIDTYGIKNGKFRSDDSKIKEGLMFYGWYS